MIAEGLDASQATLFNNVEVKKAVYWCHAIGPDDVPAEVFKALCRKEQLLAAFADFYHGFLTMAKMSSDWGHAVFKLLARTNTPMRPADFRPITVSSRNAEVFSKLLLRCLLIQNSWRASADSCVTCRRR